MIQRRSTRLNFGIPEPRFGATDYESWMTPKKQKLIEKNVLFPKDVWTQIKGFMFYFHPLAIEWQRQFRMYMCRCIWFNRIARTPIPTEYEKNIILGLDLAIRQSIWNQIPFVEFEKRKFDNPHGNSVVDVDIKKEMVISKPIHFFKEYPNGVAYMKIVSTATKLRFDSQQSPYSMLQVFIETKAIVDTDKSTVIEFKDDLISKQWANINGIFSFDKENDTLSLEVCKPERQKYIRFICCETCKTPMVCLWGGGGWNNEIPKIKILDSNLDICCYDELSRRTIL